MRQFIVTIHRRFKDKQRRFCFPKLILCLMSLILSMCVSVSSSQAFVDLEKLSLTKGLAHYAMGQIYDLHSMTNNAILEYQKAAQFDDKSFLTHLRLGTSYARLDMLEEAIFELELVGKYDNEDLQSHYLLALIYSTQKNYEKAADEYEFILKSFAKTEPQNIEIYGYLGQLYYSQKKFDKAINQFEKMLELESDNPDILYLLGSLYLEVDKSDRSVEMLKNAIEINPNHDGSLNTLGYIYAENNENLDEAVLLIKKALEVRPGNGAYLDSLGWVYYKKEMYEKALDIFKEAEVVMKDPVIYEHIGDVHYKLNNVEDAVKYWELSLGLLPDQEKVIQKLNEIKSSQAKSQTEEGFLEELGVENKNQ